MTGDERCRHGDLAGREDAWCRAAAMPGFIYCAAHIAQVNRERSEDGVARADVA